MKSKISFFNKTVFWKNVTLYWPLWTIYTLVLLFAQPFLLWINYVDTLRYGVLTQEDKLHYLANQIYIEPYVWLICIMAVVTGMAVYSYLYNGKTANMIHSLPVDRSQLYGTNVLSGLSFLAVPQILTFFVTMFICLNYGMPNIEYLAQWLVLCLGIDIVAFGIVTFCAFFTGQLITMPIYVIIINCLSFLFFAIVELMVACFSYGVSGASIVSYEVAKYLSPIYAIGCDVNIANYYNKFGRLEGLEVTGAWVLLIYVMVAIGLFVAAYFVYRKRQIEQAGDLITVGWVKPIFRWGVGFCGGFFCSIYVAAVFDGIGIIVSIPVFVVLVIIFGIIFYFVADMFVQKTFRVFGKKHWKKCGIFVISLFVSFGALYGYAKYEENLIPDIKDVKYATIRYGYDSRFKGEDVQHVVDAHEEILAYKEEFRNASYMWDTETVRISYTLESGKTISRYYSIPLELYDGDLFTKLRELEMEPDNFLRNMIDENYTEIENFRSGHLNYSDSEYHYRDLVLSGEVSKKVFDAIIADANAGTLQPYNMDYAYYYEDYDGEYYDMVQAEMYDRMASITLSYYVSEDVAQRILSQVDIEERYKYENYTAWYYDEITDREYYYSIVGGKVQVEAYIGFGPNCTNIIQTLIECEVIDSVDVFEWE